MKTLGFIVAWLRRIPIRFTTLFLVFFLAYLFIASWLVSIGRGDGATETVEQVVGLAEVRAFSFLAISKVAGIAVIVLLAIVLGLLLAYNLSAFCYRRIRRRYRITVSPPTEPIPGAGHQLDRFKKIGIILAGGGAKGAYQAGAMRAIYEFLEDNGALHKVKMIAGTSIGSWNAMFWMAGLVKPGPDGKSVHEEWWRSIGVSRIVEFDYYWPFWRNHFLLPTPWREAFKQIFIEVPEVRNKLAGLFVPRDGAPDPEVHYYFTRANVETGKLKFATNWPGLAKRTRPKLGSQDPSAREPAVDPDSYEIVAGDDVAPALERTSLAVFASMDLPPLFPYMKIKVHRTEWFEDGGVIDNVPIRFGTEIEGCDLLFVLPLNASFSEDVNRTSVSKRLFRVMDVRQGVLERNAFKMVYLYNELAALKAMAGGPPASAEVDVGPAHLLQQTATRREHKPISLFAICPEAPLAIGTAEFWKPREAGHAFELMYAATKHELAENFEEDTRPDWIRLVLVDPHGERSWKADF